MAEHQFTTQETRIIRRRWIVKGSSRDQARLTLSRYLTSNDPSFTAATINAGTARMTREESVGTGFAERILADDEQQLLDRETPGAVAGQPARTPRGRTRA